MGKGGFAFVSQEYHRTVNMATTLVVSQIFAVVTAVVRGRRPVLNWPSMN